MTRISGQTGQPARIRTHMPAPSGGLRLDSPPDEAPSDLLAPTGPRRAQVLFGHRTVRVADSGPPPRIPAGDPSAPGRIGTLPTSLLTIVAAYAGSDELAETQQVLRRLIRCTMEVDPAKSRTSLRKAIRSKASRPSILRQLVQLNPRLYPGLPAWMQADPKAAVPFFSLPEAHWHRLDWTARPGKGDRDGLLGVVSSRLVGDTEAAAEICKAAVQADPESLAFVLPALRSEAVCRAAVQSAVASRGKHYFDLIDAIPATAAAWRTELLEDLVAANPSYFGILEERDKTPRLCDMAFRQDPHVITKLPDAEVTVQRMVLAASARRPVMWILVGLPDEDDRWLGLVRIKGMTLSSLPWGVQARRDVCEAAVAQEPAAALSVPRQFHGEPFFRQAIEKLCRRGEAKHAQRAAYSGTSPWSQARTAPASGAGPAASIQLWTAPKSSD